MNRKLCVAAGATVTAFTAGLSTTALAQTGPTPAQTATASEAETVGDGVKEIIVTARRRNETIQQTPVAITAIAPAQMESTGSVTIVDLQGRAPNVLISPQIAGAGGASVSIRGLGFNDIEKSFDTPVAIVNDGVFIGTNTGQMLDFFDIESIEILRGPQGTLFGRNTIGGVINITRTKPTGEWGGKFQFDYGKFDTMAGRAVVNAPIIEDVLAFKGFYYRSHTDGFYRQYQTGKRVGRSNSESFGGSLLFTPSSNFNALLTVEKLNQDFNPTNTSQTKTGEGFAPFIPAIELNRNKTTDLYTVFIEPTEGVYHAPAVTLQMDGDLGSVNLTSITAYRSSREFQTQDFDASSSDLYYTFRRQRYHQFSQELRTAGNISDRIDYVAGLYYFKSRYNNIQHTRVFGGPPETLQDITGTSESYAAFADVNWEFADKLRLDFGGRFTHDQKSNLIFVGQDIGSNGFNNGNRIGTQFPKASESWKKFTPKISLDYRPDADHMVYATWSQGYRSGGFNGRAQTLFSVTTPYGIETVNSYEVGAKTAWFDRKLLFNIAAFYTAYKGMQQPSTIPTGFGTGNETVVFNVGSSKISGIEADITARPIPALTINGSLGYLKTKFKDFLTGEVIGGALRTVDYSAVDQIFSPKITAAISADYEIPLGNNGLKLTASYRHLSPYDQFITRDVTIPVPATGNVVIPRNDPRVRTRPQNLVDASITYMLNLDNIKVRMTAYGRNLLDQRGANMSFPVAGLWTFAAAQEPRTYGVQFGFQF